MLGLASLFSARTGILCAHPSYRLLENDGVVEKNDEGNKNCSDMTAQKNDCLSRTDAESNHDTSHEWEKGHDMSKMQTEPT